MKEYNSFIIMINNMLFIVFQYLVRSISKTIPCQACKKHFRLRDIYIVDLLEGEVYIEMNCRNCEAQTTIAANITPNQQGIQLIQDESMVNNDSKDIQKKTSKVATTQVSKNELKKLNTMLKSYKGGFKSLFKK